MKCKIHHDTDLIPTIFRDVTGFKSIGCVSFPEYERKTYWEKACPKCTQDHWESVYNEWGTFFVWE